MQDNQTKPNKEILAAQVVVLEYAAGQCLEIFKSTLDRLMNLEETMHKMKLDIYGEEELQRYPCQRTLEIVKQYVENIENEKFEYFKKNNLKVPKELKSKEEKPQVVAIKQIYKIAQGEMNEEK